MSVEEPRRLHGIALLCETSLTLGDIASCQDRENWKMSCAALALAKRSPKVMSCDAGRGGVPFRVSALSTVLHRHG